MSRTPCGRGAVFSRRTDLLEAPVVGVLPASVDGISSTLFLCQFPLLVHVGSSYQLDSQAKALLTGQTQSLQQKRPGLLKETEGSVT